MYATLTLADGTVVDNFRGLTIAAEEEFTITMKEAPDQHALTWSVSDTDVLTATPAVGALSAACVAVDAGTASITVRYRALEGSRVIQELTFVLPVTVTAAP